MFFSFSRLALSAILCCVPLLGFAQQEENDWHRVTEDHFTVEFPTKPKLDVQGKKKTYTSLDASTFPVTLYMLVVNESKDPIDANTCITERIETLSNHPMKLLWSELVDSDGLMILDTLTSDTVSRVMRSERMFVGKNTVYTLTTLFFPGSAENHDLFIQSFASNYTEND